MQRGKKMKKWNKTKNDELIKSGNGMIEQGFLQPLDAWFVLVLYINVAVAMF